MEKLKKIGMIAGMIAGVIAVIVEGHEILTSDDKPEQEVAKSDG